MCISLCTVNYTVPTVDGKKTVVINQIYDDHLLVIENVQMNLSFPYNYPLFATNHSNI